MGNTLGKTSQRLSDQFLSCGNRRKKKLAKLSNGGLQSSSPSPGGRDSVVPPPSTAGKNQASSTRQEEESVSLLSHRTLSEATAAPVRECQEPKDEEEKRKDEGEALDYEKGEDEEFEVQESPRMTTAPPPSPAQQEPSLISKPTKELLLEKVKEVKELNRAEDYQCVIVNKFDRSNSNNSNSDSDRCNENTTDSCTGVIQEKIDVKNIRQHKLDENIENLDKYFTDVLKPKQDDPLKELENRQDAIFARLHKIQDELDKMSTGCDNKTTQSSNGPSANFKFQDLVIGVDPSQVPLSLLILYVQLSQSLKVKTSVFVHSTVKKSPLPHLQSMLKSALPARQPDECRTTNDLLLTFIYKQVRQDCSLMVNPEQQTYIYGEVNVARYLSRLVNPDYDSNPVTSTQIDHWLDLASLMLWNGNGKAKSQMVQNIDSAVSKKKWLVGQDLSLADIIVWSGLHYAKMMDKLPSSVQSWRKNCENHPYFSLVTKLNK